VLNISEEGLGLLIYRVNEKNLALERIHNVQIGIRLPNTNSPIMLSGTITRVCPIGNSAMASLGVLLVPTEKQARQLKSYIHFRQAEINDELASAVYRILVDPIETKDQYF
jgi:hypothetical protein